VLSRLRRARAGSLAAFAVLALAAALVDLGGLHRHEHADSILPVLVSLQRWTPFYWDQERYGMLVPLLALPVRDPLWNLLLQRGLLVLAGLAAVLLLARHALAGREWRLAGLLGAALLLALAPGPWAFEYLGDQPYGLSLALALAGLAWAEPGQGPGDADRRAGAGTIAGGLALVLLAHWVNAAAGLLLLPLAFARAAVDWLEGGRAAVLRERLAVEAGLLAAGLAAGQAMLRLYPVLSGHPLRLDARLLPSAEWPSAWAALSRSAWEGAGPAWGAALAAAAGLGLSFLWLGAAREPGAPHPRLALLRAGALVAAALAYALLTGGLRWVAENRFHWRYVAPSVLLVHLAAVSLLAEPLARARRLARPALWAAAALVPAAALLAAGAPSLARARADLDRAAGAWTADVLAARCDLVAGDYWSVWPAVWHATLVARERGDPAVLYGITHRTNPTVRFWEDRPRGALRICRVRGAEAEAERWLRAFHLWPVELVERRRTVDLVAPAAPPKVSRPEGDPRTSAGRSSPPP